LREAELLDIKIIYHFRIHAMRKTLLTVTVMAMIIIVVGCTKPTPHQRLAKEYDSCMEYNKYQKLCEEEVFAMIKSYKRIIKELSIKYCPNESKEWEKAKDGVITYDTIYKLSALQEGPQGDLNYHKAMIKEMDAQLAVFECVTQAEPHLADDNQINNKYARSGQAERDAGLVN
jgi:hypothetical protein